MEMVTNVILGVVIVVVTFLVVCYLSGRKKANYKKSSGEKLACTLQKKFSHYMDDLNRKLRTPEDIQQEMLDALDDYKAAKVDEVKKVIVNLTNTESNINSNITKLQNAKQNIVSSILKMKENPDSDPNIGGQMVMQVEQLDKSIAASKKSLDNLKNQVMSVNATMAKLSNKIEMKRAEVLTLISTYIANSCSKAVKFDIDLSDLMGDYTNEMTVMERTSKIDEIVEAKVTDVPDDTNILSPQEYIDKYKNFK